MARNPVLIGVLLLASSVWTGSLVCLAVVANAARRSLDPAARGAFFRSLGRRYGIVGDGALAVAIGVGLTMVVAAVVMGQPRGHRNGAGRRYRARRATGG